MADIIGTTKITKKGAGIFSDKINIDNSLPQSGIIDTLRRSESMTYTN